MHTHLKKSSWEGTQTSTAHQTQTKRVTYSMTISFNQIYSSATKVITQLASLEKRGMS